VSAMKIGTTSRQALIGALMAGAAMIASPAAARPLPLSRTVTIDWTAHGIPHVRAGSFRGLGYGYGYAVASLDICGIADTVMTFSGKRARYLGAESADMVRMLGRRPIANDREDLVRRLLVDDDAVRAMRAGLSSDLRDLVDGYARGINRYVAGTGVDRLPTACRGNVPTVTGDDILRRVAGMATLLGSGLFLHDIYDAAPPGAGAADAPIVGAQPSMGEHLQAGSNAYAFGRAMTGQGGLLLGNPHFFWDGPDRFIEAHLTIPGRYDVMGASLLGMPLINIGFNRTLAWSHTVSTDKRGAVYVLVLDPRDPTRYMIDGRSIAMTRRHVTIPVRRADGSLGEESHDFWLTRFGPVVASAAMPWTRTRAFALRDANLGNARLLEQWLQIGQSGNVAALRHSLTKTLGLPWVNTIAADSRGRVLYADMSVAPNLTAAELDRCAMSVKLPLDRYVATLDGSRSTCDWPGDARAPQAGILPGEQRPALLRDDYVENSNGSYWLANPRQPLEGYSPIIGPERSALNFRTRQGHLQVADRSELSPIGREQLETLLHADRSIQADLVVGALVAACAADPHAILGGGEKISLDEACGVLSRWDRRFDPTSRGAHLFALFVAYARRPGTEDLAENTALWKVPFDPARPLDTPRDFNTADPTVLTALGRAVKTLQDAQIPLDARLGDVQFVTRNGVRLPLSGGATFSAISATLRKGIGFTDPLNPSNSYIQVVSLGQGAPVADAVLASSQSSDPASPFYSDQTRIYSEKGWVRLPFTSAAIRKARRGPRVVLETR